MYAVLETGGKQYRVAAGDKLEIEHLEAEAGQPVTFDRVLLVNNEGQVSVGAPTVTGASVVADVIEHKRGKKVTTFKMKRRKGYHKTIGHRQRCVTLWTGSEGDYMKQLLYSIQMHIMLLIYQEKILHIEGTGCCTILKRQLMLVKK